MTFWDRDRAAQWVKDEVRRRFARREILLTRYTGEVRSRWLESVAQVMAERRSLLSHGEMCQLISALRATQHVPGDVAEFGAAYGASAKIIAQYSGGRRLHLFDTFEGLPEPGPHDSPRFRKGYYNCSLESVREYLKGQPVEFYAGLFSATAASVQVKSFSFVHLDVDLYGSTLEGLKFFYPRMSRGGIIISHDYQSADGVDKAFSEFFSDKPEPVVGLSGYQCLVIKL